MNTHFRIAACFVALLLAGGAQAGTNPWFGVWKLRLTDPSEKPETLIYSDAGNGAMRMVSVEAGSVILTHFDGKPAHDIGAADGGGRTLAVRAVSPISYTWAYSVAGKTIAEGKNTLAPDLRTFTEVSWSVTKPVKTFRLVYERQ